MASKLSINQIHAEQPLAQVKTGEIFTVQLVDLSAKKVTISNEAGEEKVVSKATLERWYRELTNDEVQKWNESKAAEENQDGADAGEADGVQEADSDADEAGAETAETADEAGEDGAGEADGNAEEFAGEDSGDSGDDAPSAGGSTGESGKQPEPDGGADMGEYEQSSEEGVASPITPSNAGKDKDKAKEGKKESEAAKKNAALMKVRQTIIDTILADSDSIQLKRTGGYDVLKEKHNFAEITRGTNRFNVSVMSKCLTEDQINKVKINPASFGWSIDADFTVFDEGDIEMAVQLIRQSREYRLAHPVTRKKKESAAGKGTK